MVHSGARILVSESDALLLVTLAEDLRAAGFDVLEAETGTNALDLLAYPDEIDLVVTSLGTAGADGLEVARRARTHGQPVPVVFVSGRSDLPRAEAHPPARSQRLAKPFTTVALRRAIDDYWPTPESSSADSQSTRNGAPHKVLACRWLEEFYGLTARLRAVSWTFPP